MGITTIMAGMNTLDKILPVIEAVAKEIGPVVETETTDGKAVWADVLKAFDDLKVALAAVKAAAN